MSGKQYRPWWDAAFAASHLGQHCLLKPVDKIHTIKYNIWKGHAQVGKIMIKSSAITNRLSVTMAGLIIDYFFQLWLASLTESGQTSWLTSYPLSEPQGEKTYLRTCAPSEGSDQPVRIFTGRILDVSKFHHAGYKDANQQWGMRRLICVFFGYICQKVCFLILCCRSNIVYTNGVEHNLANIGSQDHQSSLSGTSEHRMPDQHIFLRYCVVQTYD